ncbi:hypothetical protein PTKIN_Ptkin08bG0103500 [Pterospermum kingtungense]
MLKLPDLPTTRECEALALYEVLVWVLELGYLRVIFKVDSKLVADAVKSSCEDYTEFGSIVVDCRLLLQNLDSSQVLFAQRSANEATHIIAKRSQFASVSFFFFFHFAWLAFYVYELCMLLY